MLFYLAVAILTLAVIVLIDGLRGLRAIKFAKDLKPGDAAQLPKVSIVVAALNEEETIAPALASLLTLDYESYEVIVINDRSTDGTQAILEDMAQKDGRIKVTQVTSLPSGWLGKNHALHFGSQLASGDYLLFTDADIVLEETVLKRVMRHVNDNDLHHVSLLYDSVAPGGLLNMMILETLAAILYLFRPWNAKRSDSRSYIGVGAFNLVKRDVYAEIEGHERIAMCPVDDLMLGMIIKRSGFRQDFLFGNEMVRVAWYHTIAELRLGTRKNIFAFFNYNLALVIASTVSQILFAIWPLLALFLTSGSTQLLNGLILLTRMAGYAALAPKVSIKRRVVLWWPISSFVAAYNLWQATLTTLLNRGITWRGTFYALEDLKAGRPKYD